MRVLLALLLVLAASPGEARPYRQHYHPHHFRLHQQPRQWHQQPSGYVWTRASAGQVVPHPAGCPRRLFCACGVSVKVFGRAIPALFSTAAWLRFPRAAPGPGMVATNHRHAFAILENRGNGRVLAYDANSGGGLTRIHEVSLRGYTIVNPHGGKM